MHNRPAYNNEYITTKISPHNEKLHGNKKFTEREYFGHSILLLESIYEVEHEYYPQTLLDKFFKIHNDNNINKLFKELVQITDCSDNESNN